MLSVIYWKLISIDSNLKKIHTELVLQRTGGVSFDLPRRGR